MALNTEIIGIKTISAGTYEYTVLMEHQVQVTVKPSSGTVTIKAGVCGLMETVGTTTEPKTFTIPFRCNSVQITAEAETDVVLVGVGN